MDVESIGLNLMRVIVPEEISVDVALVLCFEVHYLQRDMDPEWFDEFRSPGARRDDESPSLVCLIPGCAHNDHISWHYPRHFCPVQNRPSKLPKHLLKRPKCPISVFSSFIFFAGKIV